MGGILVLCEHRRGELREITLELLGLARSLAESDASAVAAVLLEGGGPELAESLRGCADTVEVVHGPGLADGDSDAVVDALAGLVQQRRPHLLLIGHTAAGVDVAPALATRLGLPLQTDCVGVELGDHGLRVQRQPYGGKLNELLDLRPADGFALTIRPASYPAVQGDGRSTEILDHAADAGPGRGRRVVGLVEAALEDVDITEAEVLVAVGRGLGSPEHLPAIEAFAEAIGATLACSRPVADKGWMSKSRQVGSSGRVVRPQLYVALGISGAYQHVVGMRGAATILAVNSDPRAPIFEVADYGIVADMHEVLPALAERFSTS